MLVGVHRAARARSDAARAAGGLKFSPSQVTLARIRLWAASLDACPLRRNVASKSRRNGRGKSMIDRRDVLRGATATLLGSGVGATPAFAQQDYPNRAVRALIGFPAGSGADILGRYFTAKLQDLSGQPVIVENKPG